MKEHIHAVYVTETVGEVVNSLRNHGVNVDYSPEPEDREDANGYIEEGGCVISSCVRWRTTKDPRFLAMIPEKAMACLELLSSAKNFGEVRASIERNLRIVRNCCGGLVST